jgi:hypothetical protein
VEHALKVHPERPDSKNAMREIQAAKAASTEAGTERGLGSTHNGWWPEEARVPDELLVKK